MITANEYTIVEFDNDGRERIESAIFTIRDVVDALRKVGGQTSGLEDELETGASCLQAILDNTRW